VRGGKIFREFLGPFHPLLDNPRLFREEDEMSDDSNLESQEKWRFRGHKVPVLKGHSTHPLFVKRDDSVSDYGPSTDWEDIDSGDGNSGELLSATSFANHDDWQLEPYFEDERTGKRMKTADDERGDTVSSSSSADNMESAKPFSAKVVEEEPGEVADGLV